VNKYTFKENNMKLKYHDVVINNFVGDLWLVDYFKNDELRLCLVPNSGCIGHPKNIYPAHTEDLDIAEEDMVGEVEDANWEYLGNLDDKPEILEGFNYIQ
jgi:hypothetical protein